MNNEQSDGSRRPSMETIEGDALRLIVDLIFEDLVDGSIGPTEAIVRLTDAIDAIGTR